MNVTKAAFEMMLPLGLLGICPPPAMADWPQCRGPGGLGLSSAKGLPVTGSADKNVVWKAGLPGPGASSLFNASPAIVGNRLLLRSDRYLYCIGQK